MVFGPGKTATPCVYVCAVRKGMLVGRGISLWICCGTNAMSNKQERRSYHSKEIRSTWFQMVEFEVKFERRLCVGSPCCVVVCTAL